MIMSSAFNKKLCLSHLTDLIPLAFDPMAVLFRNCSIDLINVIDYFDYWEKF